MGRFTIRNSELIPAISVSIYETVKAALENDDRQNVKDIEADLNRRVTQTAEYVRFRRDLGGGKLKNLGAGAQKCPRGPDCRVGQLRPRDLLRHKFYRPRNILCNNFPCTIRPSIGVTFLY